MAELEKINAFPTKKLFISMLVKDITLVDAIGDLIDNCVDGALSLRPDKNYKGLWIKIHADENSFSIEDNCGGISYENARDYAFRFGRTDDTPSIAGSVGQFGIGMKRSLFKMGKFFRIKTTSQRSEFTLEVNVDKWEKLEDWTFEFKELIRLGINDSDYPEAKRGTKITVSSLSKDVRERFNLETFITQLRKEIEFEHLFNIDKGLIIKINDVKLDSRQLLIINSDEFKPAMWTHEFETGLRVKAIAGIGEKDLDHGGWYIFCNARMILGAEQTKISGWGIKKPVKIPKYHNQFERFRGFVFFEADNPSLLPWNTSKNNPDIDSPAFTFARLQMVSLMRPVIDFLNKLHDERQKIEGDSQPLNIAVEKADENTISVSRIIDEHTEFSETFVYPQTPPLPRVLEGAIQYHRPLAKIEKVQKMLGVNSLREVGERTFDYFYENECEG